MTTDVISGVPRELRSVLSMILSALDRDAAEGKTVRGEMAEELRALLATAPPADDETLHCDFCQAETADPWHGSGVFDGVERRHVHACEACRPKLKNTQPAADGERELIREVFLRNGFSIKDGHDDLKPYVYAAGFDLLEKARADQPQQAVAVTDEVRRLREAHDVARKVREALDRQACPNAWMVIAYEATVAALTQSPKGEEE